MPEKRSAAIDALLEAGERPDKFMEALYARAEERNREAQAKLPTPATMTGTEWATREAWLHDGQPITGELKVFAHAAYRAAKVGDQVTFSRQRDLLYKAVLTFVGVPSVDTVDPVEVV